MFPGLFPGVSTPPRSFSGRFLRGPPGRVFLWALPGISTPPRGSPDPSWGSPGPSRGFRPLPGVLRTLFEFLPALPGVPRPLRSGAVPSGPAAPRALPARPAPHKRFFFPSLCSFSGRKSRLKSRTGRRVD